MFLDPFFLRGILMGFIIALPVGPMGILCVRRSLHYGARMGWMTGFGIATGDAVYGTIAAFGMTAISSFLMSQRILLGALGCIFLLYLGIHALFFYHKKSSSLPVDTDYVRAFTSSFFLTLSNPATILAFVAIYAVIGAGQAPNYCSALLFVLGIFLGSMSWWVVLGGVTGYVRKRIAPHMLHWVNRGAGVLLIFLALLMMLELFARRLF